MAELIGRGGDQRQHPNSRPREPDARQRGQRAGLGEGEDTASLFLITLLLSRPLNSDTRTGSLKCSITFNAQEYVHQF